MVQLELAKWLTREVGEDKADQVIAFMQVCNVVPLNTEIALAAAEAWREYKLATVSLKDAEVKISMDGKGRCHMKFGNVAFLGRYQFLLVNYLNHPFLG